MNSYLELFLDFLKSEKNSSENTVQSYLSDLQDFIDYSEAVSEITESQIIGYLEVLKKKEFQVSTIKRKVSSMRQFFKFLRSEGLIEKDPMTFIRQPKGHRALPKIISENSVKCLRNALSNFPLNDRVRNELILCLLYGSGLRVSELISLKMNSFIEGKFVRIMGKGSRERIVPISHQVLELFSEWKEIKRESLWLFPSRDPKKHMTRQRVFQMIKQIASFSGIDVAQVSPHVLRHAFATHILDHGADLLSVKKMLGHQDIATTEIYTHISRAHLKEVLNKSHPLGDSARMKN